MYDPVEDSIPQYLQAANSVGFKGDFIMADFKGKIYTLKDKVVGEVKEVVGKVTDNDELELKGKIQSSGADIRKKADDVKDDIADKLNDLTDKK